MKELTEHVSMDFTSFPRGELLQRVIISVVSLMQSLRRPNNVSCAILWQKLIMWPLQKYEGRWGKQHDSGSQIPIDHTKDK